MTGRDEARAEIDPVEALAALRSRLEGLLAQLKAGLAALPQEADDRPDVDAAEAELAAVSVLFRAADSALAHRIAALSVDLQHFGAPYLQPVRPGNNTLSWLRRLVGRRASVPALLPLAADFSLRASALLQRTEILIVAVDRQRAALANLLPACEDWLDSVFAATAGGRGDDEVAVASAERRDRYQAAGLDLVDLLIEMTRSTHVLGHLLAVEAEACVMLVGGLDPALLAATRTELPHLSRQAERRDLGLLSVRSIRTRRAHLRDLFHQRYAASRQAASRQQAGGSLPQGAQQENA